MSIAYYKTAIVGGTSNSLDGEDGNLLQDNDFAICLVGGETSFYKLDATSGLSELYPDVISPDTNPGTKRWILQSVVGGITDADDIDDTSTINKFVTATDLTKLANTSGINTGDQDLSTLALKANVLELDNTTTYTPTLDYHPTTKKYMDEQVIAGGGYTDEQALDIIGSSLVDSTSIDFTFDDGANTITGDVIPGGVMLDTLGIPTDITTLNASTSRHGLLPKLNGSTTQYLSGTGAWTTPAGGGGSVDFYINAMDYGATGDNSTDDAPAIQAALDYAATLTAATNTGGKVLLPPGRYVLNSSLSWTASQITLGGIADGTAQLFCNFAAGDIIRIGDGTADINHGMLEHVFISCRVTKTSGAAIAIKGGHNCGARNVRMDSGNLWDGITIDGRVDTSSYLTFIDNFEIGNLQNHGIVIGGDPTLVRPIGVYFSNGIVANVDGDGIKIVTTDGSYFSTIDILGCTNSVHFAPIAELPSPIGPDQDNATNMFFYSVLADTSNGDGFNLQPAGGTVSGINFVACWGASCAYQGFNMDATSGVVANISMSNCRAVNNRKHGIHLNNGANKITISNTQVYGNSVLNNGIYDGIHIGANITDFNISNGTIWSELFPGYNHQRYGIYISSGCYDFIISGVNVKNNKIAGIVDDSGNTTRTITNCIGYFTQNQGISRVASGTDTAVVTHSLSVTPVSPDIVIQPVVKIADAGADYIWLTNITSTTFTVTANYVTTNDLWFSWKIDSKKIGSEAI